MATSSIDAKLERISFAVEGSVARLTLHNPPLNVIDIRMVEELDLVLAEIGARTDVAVLVLGGCGEAFSAGVDVAAHAPEKIEEMLTKFHAAIRTLVSTAKITLARVQGQCLGGGAELVMVCDFVITSEDALWGFPEIKLGCYPPVACTALAALVGQKRAAELIMTGRTIRGREAAEIGLATRALPAAELDRAIEDFIAPVLQLSPAALAIAKEASYVWEGMHFDKGLARAEKIYLEQLMKTSDAQEGIRAFLEKRHPKWTGS
jgi:cyclohexa-1,5-dienecarbonyl-CoA hydratase